MLETWTGLLLYKKFKGQVVSTEFLFVIVILIALLVISISLWNFGNVKVREQSDRIIIESQAFKISDQLVKFTGLPNDWEEDEKKLAAVGLAKSDRVLDQKKVQVFVNMSYEKLKNYLGTGGFDFYFRIIDFENDVLNETGKKPTDPTNVVNARRTAFYNETIVYVDVILWR